MSVYCFVAPSITKRLPSTSVKSSGLLIPNNLQLTDPCFCDPGNIDALIVGKFFLKLLETGKIDLGDGLPVLQNTKLGWIVSGPVPSQLTCHAINTQMSYHICLTTTLESFERTLRRFWELEEYADDKPKLFYENGLCEKQYEKTTMRNASGRFVVRLPFRENSGLLGQSRGIEM
ncbi:uncharacterized protein [Cardiocondyla obscurior]|uniref:uncharacterized protein n=1 Tax=Cardiocondyla obscurior TaxID=286306 RepID=UPI00396586B4